MTGSEIDRNFPGESAQRAADKYTWRFPNGESYADADTRAARALEAIRATGVRRPLVVSHEMIGRMLLKNLGDLDVPTSLALRQPHNVVYVIDVPTRSIRRIKTEPPT